MTTSTITKATQVSLSTTLASRTVTVRNLYNVDLPECFPEDFNLSSLIDRIAQASSRPAPEVEKFIAHLAVSQLLIQFRKAVEDKANALLKADITPDLVVTKVEAEDWLSWFPTRSGRATTSAEEKVAKELEAMASKAGGHDELLKKLQAMIAAKG